MPSWYLVLGVIVCVLGVCGSKTRGSRQGWRQKSQVNDSVKTMLLCTTERVTQQLHNNNLAKHGEYTYTPRLPQPEHIRILCLAIQLMITCHVHHDDLGVSHVSVQSDMYDTMDMTLQFQIVG